MDAPTRSETRAVGGIVQAFSEELKFAEVIDKLGPCERDAPLGGNPDVQPGAGAQVAVSQCRMGGMSLLHRLLRRMAEQLNDDRLGRGLECVNKYGRAVQAALVANAAAIQVGREPDWILCHAEHELA